MWKIQYVNPYCYSFCIGIILHLNRIYWLCLTVPGKKKQQQKNTFTTAYILMDFIQNIRDHTLFHRDLNGSSKATPLKIYMGINPIISKQFAQQTGSEQLL